MDRTFLGGGQTIRTLVFGILFFLCATFLFSQFSLGLSLGQPSGVTAKYNFSETVALDIGISYSFFWVHRGYYVHTDIVHIFPRLLQIGKTHFPLYAGVGFGYLGIQGFQDFGHYLLSIRVPFGVFHRFPLNRTYIEGFLEITPTVNILPIQSFTMAFRIGARYQF